jgi:glucosamine--fructose-6-phosphate aminotransferase (isomerizing)
MTLWGEIHEQPEVLRRLLRNGREPVLAAAARLARHDVRYVVVAARGSSDNAARYAQYLWGGRNGRAVALAAPALFGPDASPPALDGSAVVGISQSGQSPDIVAVLEEARRRAGPPCA